MGWNGHCVVQLEHELGAPDVSMAAEPIFPAYDTGTITEFFSETNCQWIFSIVQVSCLEGVASYNLDFGRGLHQRKDVRLNRLRSPLVPGELCSYFSKSDMQWLPAVILTAPPERSAHRGFTLRIIDQEAPICSMAHLLRRRYVPGECVEVYKGEKTGWVDAQVTGEMEQREGADVCNIPEISHVAISTTTQASERHNDDNKVTIDRGPTNVQVQFGDGSAQVFPTYLMRRYKSLIV